MLTVLLLALVALEAAAAVLKPSGQYLELKGSNHVKVNLDKISFDQGNNCQA